MPYTDISVLPIVLVSVILLATIVAATFVVIKTTREKKYKDTRYRKVVELARIKRIVRKANTSRVGWVSPPVMWIEFEYSDGQQGTFKLGVGPFNSWSEVIINAPNKYSPGTYWKVTYEFPGNDLEQTFLYSLENSDLEVIE